MALSDACHDFLEAVKRASAELAEQAHHYSAPDYSGTYGLEVDVIRRLAASVAESPNTGGAELLMELATKVMQYLDSLPGSEESEHYRKSMHLLMGIFTAELSPQDAAEATRIAEIVTDESKATPQTVERFKGLLGKLGKSSYDVVVKIVSDVASATVKKMLGI